MNRKAPAERVRSALEEQAGADLARSMPTGYQRLGRVLLLRLPEALRPHFGTIGRAWVRELRVGAVLRYRGAMAGELRVPDVELIAGSGTEAEVREHGVRYRLDAARVMFAAGNRTERQRIGKLVRSGEQVVDLFAGIGYFALPAALEGRAARVYACEKNPVSFEYLVVNVRVNGLGERVMPVPGDNLSVDLPLGVADRVLMGYLPSSIPWLPRALSLLRPAGGTLHVHLVEGTRGGVDAAHSRVRQHLGRLGARVGDSSAREVKPYGPGRLHAVVDVYVRPPEATSRAMPERPGP
ncbi:MAG: class I SAM-dependent methyltransferase family protein [Thermoplasmata archaeon]|nr:class I SAM-dependent methyltransferase family protein [Thermoplasmata archaeon]